MITKIIQITREQKEGFQTFSNSYKAKSVLHQHITITPNGYQITLEGKADEIENFLSELNMYLN